MKDDIELHEELTYDAFCDEVQQWWLARADAGDPLALELKAIANTVEGVAIAPVYKMVLKQTEDMLRIMRFIVSTSSRNKRAAPFRGYSADYHAVVAECSPAAPTRAGAVPSPTRAAAATSLSPALPPHPLTRDPRCRRALSHPRCRRALFHLCCHHALSHPRSHPRLHRQDGLVQLLRRAEGRAARPPRRGLGLGRAGDRPELPSHCGCARDRG